jgi:hypothetical protein
MIDPHRQIDEAYQLIHRLERLSADSAWAHQASGLRGSLLRHLDRLEAEPQGWAEEDLRHLQRLSAAAFDILQKAAREIPDTK